MKVFSRGSLGNEGMFKGVAALKCLTTPGVDGATSLL